MTLTFRLLSTVALNVKFEMSMFLRVFCCVFKMAYLMMLLIKQMRLNVRARNTFLRKLDWDTLTH